MTRAVARIALSAALLVAALPAHAQRITAVAVDRSAIAFVSKQMNVPVDGKFGRFSAEISFDAGRPSEAKVSIEVDLNSIDTGSDEANAEVKGRSWFDVKSFPSAKFVSTGVKALGGGRFEVTGKLTIKGRTRDVAAPLTFKPDAQGGVFDGSFTLKRLDYGIGSGVWSDTDTVANEVQIKFHVTGVGGTPKQ